MCNSRGTVSLYSRPTHISPPPPTCLSRVSSVSIPLCEAIQTVHCPKNNMNLHIKALVGADATV